MGCRVWKGHIERGVYRSAMITKDGSELADKGINSFKGETFGAIVSFRDLGRRTKMRAAFLVYLSFRILVVPYKKVDDIDI